MKDLFSSLKTRLLGGGGQQAFNLQEKLHREGELLTNCNFDSLYKNDLQGGDLYLSTVTSAENLIGGGKLSKSNIWCATLCSNEGGARHLVLAAPNIFKLSTSDLNVGGGGQNLQDKKGGKLFNRLLSFIWNGGEGVNNAFTLLGGEV